MDRHVVITGIGMVTPLGDEPGDVLDRMAAGRRVAVDPRFDAEGFSCRHCAPVDAFDAEAFFPENKTLRLMNRDAQMAAVAARRAMQDAGVRPDHTYPSEQIGLFGATGVTSLPIDEARRLVQLATDDGGKFDLARFGRVTLRRTRPVLSFKILANMPICFVSIFEGIRGPNAVYTPWEGQAAQAIAAGFEAIRRGDVPCALVGGCDVKTRLMSFLALEKLGAFAAWKHDGRGFVPGEGAAFLVLEDEQRAVERSARCYARVADHRRASLRSDTDREKTYSSIHSAFDLSEGTLIVAGDEASTLNGNHSPRRVCPKAHLGDLYAAAAAVQVGLGATLLARDSAVRRVVANCFGFGEEQASFLLEAP